MTQDAAPADDGDVVDQLPADLVVENYVGNITFPNNSRRRVPAVIYLLLGIGAVVLAATRDASPLVNRGIGVAGAVLIVFALYGLWAGRRMTVDESEALERAATTMPFAVGHASAQQVWRGWSSRPTWRILLYSPENPPKERGIALVDAVDGGVVESFSEPNPEDWSNRFSA